MRAVRAMTTAAAATTATATVKKGPPKYALSSHLSGFVNVTDTLTRPQALKSLWGQIK
jgi:hypothetical protein